MCDYCDCRSHTAIATLSADHERLLADLTRLRVAAEANNAEEGRAIAKRLHGCLHDHADREERGVFEQLALAGVGDDYLGRFTDEHERVHDLLRVVVTTALQPAALELARVLTEHIAREETDLFPAAHQQLAPQQWDAVDAVHATNEENR
jgi:hemerythrin-like domain-containing protein